MTRDKFIASIIVVAIAIVTSMNPRALGQQTIVLDFDSISSGANFTTQWPWGSTVLSGNAVSIGDIVDPDIVAAGGGGKGGRTRGTTSATLTLNGAVATSIEFLYGATGNRPPDSGGFQAATFSSTGIQGESIYQGSTFNGFPAGPVTLHGPSSSGGQFSSFKWSTTFSGGFAEIDNLRITVRPISELTPEEILRDSVTVTPNGSKIGASFRPAGGNITLAKAAELLDVDHFNWIQTVRHVPSHWTVKVVEDPTFTVDFGSGKPVEILSTFNEIESDLLASGGYNSFVDFILQSSTPGAPEKMYMFESSGGRTWWRQERADDQPFYYNEDPNVLSAVTSSTQLQFGDEPSQPDYSLNTDDYLQFQTNLVGVKKDGTYLSWQGFGTNFTWKSNRTHEGLGGVFGFGRGGVLDITDSPITAPTGGGVFDIQLDTAIPECASLQLLMIGIATLLTTRRTPLNP